MAEKGPKNFSRFMRHGTRGEQADNGLKRQPGKKWQKKGRKIFRALCAMAIKVARLKKGGQVEKRRSGKNGRKRAEKVFALYAPWYSR